MNFLEYLRRLVVYFALMGVLIGSANYLAQSPVGFLGLQDFLTYGALVYPFTFLVTDLVNRRFGAAVARRVVIGGFILGVVLSLWLATPRIALASGSAFLVAQLVDVFIFDRLRRGVWWRAPLISSLIGSAVDSFLFFGLAFAGTGANWVTLAVGDQLVKIVLVVVALPIYRAAVARAPMPPAPMPPSSA